MTEIPNALSAEEWADYADGPSSGVVLSLADVTIPRRQVHRLMAVANHALPDGHAGKFTVVDAITMRTLIGLVEAAQKASGQDASELLTDAYELAAKLLAILPPQAEGKNA
jgi:hypothetical protein